MNVLQNVYKQSLADSERNLKFWEDYLNNLRSLDFNIFTDKLTVPILVPIGNKILFRGTLKHTNEVTVALGADYFAKCSIKQAEILRQHRIKDAQLKVDLYKKEKEYLESQITFNTDKIYEHSGKDIIETCTEDEDKLWREKHKERVRAYKQNKKKEEDNNRKEITDDELWARLEELELQEELEDEYRSMTNRHDDDDNYKLYTNNEFVAKDENSLTFPDDSHLLKHSNDNEDNVLSQHFKTCADSKEDCVKMTKDDIFTQVLNKQKELEVKLMEMKNKERQKCQSEKDLINKLDEMEELDELEDEMDRLDDILNADSDDSNEKSEEISTPLKKSVSFADEDESVTLQLYFKHSDVAPQMEPYNPDKGIMKPSDIYDAFSYLFMDETSSILKKSKYDKFDTNAEIIKNIEKEEPPKQTIIVKDVMEKTETNAVLNTQTRPTSLFKKRRQQKS